MPEQKPIAELTDEEFYNAKIIPKKSTAKAFTSKELLDMDFPPPNWIVDDLIPEGFTLLAGKPKTGKSFLSLQIAAAVSIGLPVLGHFKTKKPGEKVSGVLYLAFEDTDRRLKSRYDKIQGLGSDDLKFITNPDQNLPGIKAIEDRIIDFPNTRLVIIDTLVRFLPAFDFDSYNETYPAMQSIKDISDKYNVGIIGISHTRKSGGDDFVDSISGSNAFTANADTIMVLRRGRGQADGYIEATGRDVDVDIDIALELVKDEGWKYSGEGAEFRLNKIQKSIYDLLKEAETEMTTHDIATAPALEDVSYGSVNVTLFRMVNDNQITKVKRGVYKL